MQAENDYYLDAQRFRPITSRVRPLWAKLNSAGATKRFEVARRCEQRLLAIRALIDGGIAEARAVQAVDPPVHRSTFRGWCRRYDKDGLEGLIDCRLPEPAESLPDDIQGLVCALRRADGDIGVPEIVSFVRSHHQRRVSESSVKRILKRSGLHRSCGKPRRSSSLRGTELVLGGMKLVEAAAVSTGYLEACTKTVVDHVASLPTPAGALGPDVDDRDEKGRFLGSYNERYRKGDDAAVGPGFVSVDIKRETKDPSLFHVHGASAAVVERKLWALMCSPVIGTGRWDGMRTPRGALLGELCGYAYMPSTLSLFTNELKYAGVSAALWETHACTWHSATQQWGSPRHAAVLYVDGTSKPIFTSLHSQGTHVSLYGRAMPGLDVVGFHSGYGVPLWYLGHSGRAPLVKAVPKAMARLEQQLGAEIGRIVVIDAEGNAAPFLAGLQEDGRGWVTRLRPSMVRGKSVINWTSWRPYRQNDRIREGELDLPVKKSGSLRVRLLEIERRDSGKVVHLAASKLLRVQDWKTAEVADLYFARWPNQELDFRAVNQATGFKQVHGYGKRLVNNVAVMTRLEKVDNIIQTTNVRHSKQQLGLEKLEEKHREQIRALKGALLQKNEVEQAFDEHLTGSTIAAATVRDLDQQRKDADQVVEKTHAKVLAARERVGKAHEHLQRTEQKLVGYHDEKFDLTSRREILAHDVELDSIFNVFKVGLTLLISYVLRTMLDQARMAPSTFLERIATLPARQRFSEEFEHITFEYNHRDPTTMALLIACSETINKLRLPMRSGRILKMAVEQPPQAPNASDSG
jgi:transposase